MSEETTLQQLKPSLKNYIIPLIFGVVLIPFLVGILILLWVFIDMSTNQYRVTNKRVIVRRGIIARNLDEIEIKDIRSINMRQGIIQRIFQIGDLLIGTAGQSGIEVTMKGVDRPEQLKELIRSQRA